MNTSKRFFSVLLILCILMCSSCSISEEFTLSPNSFSSTTQQTCIVGNIPCTFPLVDEDTNLNIMIASYDAQSPDGVFVWNRYEEMTGVNINWTVTNSENRNEDVFVALSNHSDMDLIMRCRIAPTDITRYGENGLLLNLMDDNLLETYAPNCWSYLQSHPDALASVMSPDGAIYSIPQINSGAELRVSRKIFINKTWLDKLGLDEPTTTDEFYDMLVAFRDQDPNGNGQQDEIPLCSPDWLSIQEGFYGTFGLMNRGVHNNLIDYDENTGGLRFIPASNGYYDFLEYFNRLYEEQLLDNNVFTTKKAEWQTNIENDRVGVFLSTNLAFVPSELVDNWIALDTALIGPNGDQLWSAVRANFHSAGAAMIPSNCSNPALVLQWLDYFWTDEGTLFYHMGVEGETYVINEDGSYDYAPAIYEEMAVNNISFDDEISKISPYPGGNNPTVEIAPYFRGGEMAEVPAQAARGLFNYGPTEYWPSFTFSTTESDIISSLSPDITKYCSDMEIAFITGEKSLEEWDSYLEQLATLNVDGLVEAYQPAVERYEELVEESN